jgi:hypothetical protein
LEFNAFLFAYIYIFEEVFVCRPYAHIYTRTKHTAHPSSLLNSAVCPSSIYSCAAACVRVE